MEIVDFTVTVMESGIVVAQELDYSNNTIFSFLSPFSNEIWIFITLAFLVAIILHGLIMRYFIELYIPALIFYFG